MTPAEIVSFLECRRMPLRDEKRLQDMIETELRAAGVTFEREVRLDHPTGIDIIDFMIGGVGLEIKIRGQRRRIYDQVERYLFHDRVRALVLATSRSIGMPNRVNLKPVYIADLNRPWL